MGSPPRMVIRRWIEIVRRALSQPTRDIVENAGADGSMVVGKLREAGDSRLGYDAQQGEYVDMVRAGIVDPTKVVRLELQNGASVAGLLITTKVLVSPIGQLGNSVFPTAAILPDDDSFGAEALQAHLAIPPPARAAPSEGLVFF
jgi:hypothetical protein